MKQEGIIKQVRNQIPRDQLIEGCWYVGRGRNANVAYWDGQCFLTIAEKCGRMVAKKERYYTGVDGGFEPFLQIDEGKDPDLDDHQDNLGKYLHRHGKQLLFNAG